MFSLLSQVSYKSAFPCKNLLAEFLVFTYQPSHLLEVFKRVSSQKVGLSK